MYLWTRKKWLNFGSRLDPGIFLKDSSTLWDRAYFHNFTDVSGQTDRILCENFTTNVTLKKESPLNFGSYPDPRSGSIPDSPWRSSALCVLRILFLIYLPHTSCTQSTASKDHEVNAKVHSTQTAARWNNVVQSTQRAQTSANDSVSGSEYFRNLMQTCLSTDTSVVKF